MGVVMVAMMTTMVIASSAVMVATVMVVVVGDQMHRCVTGGSAMTTMKRSCSNQDNGEQGKSEGNGNLLRRGADDMVQGLEIPVDLTLVAMVLLQR